MNPANLPPLPALPTRLAAPAPGWSETTDVVVVGSGIAGLTTALHLREAGLHVTVVTKVTIDDGSTRWAQGGIAAVLDPKDSPAQHAQDTEIAGVGLCDPAAVEVLVTEGPDRVRELIRFGAEFDRNPDGSLMLTREGGHRANRIVHAGGDATGAEVQRALHAAVRRDPWIRLIEHALVVDLITDVTGRVRGLTLHVLGEGTEDGVGAVWASAVVLATGGMGQMFQSTTNPAVSTGDGVALALRAGAEVTDLEFVQFHPTALFLPGGTGQQPLVSEAMRGEGAYLVDSDGKRFMLGRHELAELAPRDVVAKEITAVMRAQGTDHVWLDARHLGRETLTHRFPTILTSCRAAGIDPVTDLIPVAPAAHYASGGVRTDLHGRTTVPGLYACGEVACTGVHGANRLASNSLLEALVFARRIATDIAATVTGGTATPLIDERPEAVGLDPAPTHEAAETTSRGEGTASRGNDARRDPASPPDGGVVDASVRSRLQQTMTRGAGVLRSEESLRTAATTLDEFGQTTGRPNTDTWETTNLLTVATALVAAAYLRQETRGCHWRHDFPEASDAWRGHLIIRLGPDGQLRVRFEELS